MNIKIIGFNLETSKLLNEITTEYKKRIQKFAKIEVISYSESKISDFKKYCDMNEKVINNFLSKNNDFEKWLLDIDSNQLSSIEISKIIKENNDFKNGKILFILGPSMGFSEGFRNNFNNKLSLGKITLPHKICLLIIIEQIYRSFKIINNQNYHK